MTKTSKNGSEGGDQATFGGPGWSPRELSHAAEVAAGDLWGPCGVRSEWAPLRAVALATPGDRLGDVADPDSLLLLEAPDLDVMRGQTSAAVRFYEGRGIRVHLLQADEPAPPNLIFMRDLFFMTPEGAILGRMAGAVRAGEERFAAQALSAAGVPILATVRGEGLFEGADALWLDGDTVLIGVGFRTNEAGADQVEGVLADQGISLLRVPLPKGPQHLLGAVNRVDEDLAVALEERLTPQITTVLSERGVKLVTIPEGLEGPGNWGVNFVTLGPRSVVMPAGYPRTRELLETHGVDTSAIEVSEYLKAAGGPGCFTGILHRR